MARISQLAERLARSDGNAAISPALERIQEDQAKIASKRNMRFPKLHLAAAAALVVALTVPIAHYVVTDGSGSASATPELYRTGTAERMTVDLQDGTNLTMNAASEVTLLISDRKRHLTLVRGEIYLDVAHDPVRPFRVEVGSHMATVVGTAFEVRKRHGSAELTVDEGRVVVSEIRPGAIVAAREVDAGQTLLLKPGQYPVALSAEDLAKTSSWRDGWLHFQDRRLDAVVRDLEPYLDKNVVFDDVRARDLRVSGSFNVDRAQSALTSLEALLPVSIIYESNRIVVSYDER